MFVSRQKNQNQLWIPGKSRKIGVWVSGAEIQTSAVDTRTAVWVSTAEKFSKRFLEETRNFSRKFRGVSAPALYKTRPLIGESAKGGLELRCGSAEKVSCTGAKEVCTSANRACTGARDSFRTSVPEPQTTFSTLP